MKAMCTFKQINPIYCCLIAVLLLQISCKTYPPTDLTKENIIPKPVLVEANGETFSLTKNVCIYTQGSSEKVSEIAGYLATLIRPSTGFGVEVKAAKGTLPKGSILLSLSDVGASPGDEGYVLEITKKLVKITANNPAGLFRGIQTFRQLLPAEIEMNTKQDMEWLVAGGVITDYPVYA